jgi:predicted anti-sigma-YlaC factor YlaD
MPECGEIVSMLSDYLDRDLPADTCVAIARHLESCRSCGMAADELRSTVDLCRQYRLTGAPGPLPRDKQEQLREVFERTLSEMKKGS